MVAPDKDPANRPAVLLANHRGESLRSLRAWFEDRGWPVAVSGDLATTLELLSDGEIGAVVVYPLTLDPESLEWQQLSARLSPTLPRPWLVSGWREASIDRMQALLATAPGVSDWAHDQATVEEIEGRLEQLLRMQKLLAEGRAREEQLRDQLVHDQKTGLYNDAHFRDRMEQEFQRSLRHGQPLTLVLLDLDDFKSLNDEMSYEAGDLALRCAGEAMAANVRSIDLAARFGGDEFALLLPNTTLAEGVAVTNRVRGALRTAQLEPGADPVSIELSAGIATFEGRGLPTSRELFLAANRALQQAKRDGKNRIAFHDPRERRPLAQRSAAEQREKAERREETA